MSATDGQLEGCEAVAVPFKQKGRCEILGFVGFVFGVIRFLRSNDVGNVLFLQQVQNGDERLGAGLFGSCVDDGLSARILSVKRKVDLLVCFNRVAGLVQQFSWIAGALGSTGPFSSLRARPARSRY